MRGANCTSGATTSMTCSWGGSRGFKPAIFQLPYDSLYLLPEPQLPCRDLVYSIEYKIISQRSLHCKKQTGSLDKNRNKAKIFFLKKNIYYTSFIQSSLWSGGAEFERCRHLLCREGSEEKMLWTPSQWERTLMMALFYYMSQWGEGNAVPIMSGGYIYTYTRGFQDFLDPLFIQFWPLC